MENNLSEEQLVKDMSPQMAVTKKMKVQRKLGKDRFTTNGESSSLP